MADSILVPIGFDDTGVEKSLDRVGDLYDSFRREVEQGVELKVDAGSAQQELVGALSGVADELDEIKARLEGNISVQKRALTALELGGKQGTAEYNHLLESLRENTAELNRMESAAESVNDSVSKPKRSPLDVLSNAATFEGIGKVGEFFDGLSEQSEGSLLALQRLKVQSGLTGEEFEKLKGQADDTFRSVGGAIEDARNAVGSASLNVGKFLPKEELDEAATFAIKFGRVYEKDVNETLGKSAPLISNFKLKGKEAFDLIALGQRDAMTADDDFLDTIKEYSVQFKEAGFSADEFVGTLIKGVDEGAFNTDKLADGIKEAQIRIKSAGGDVKNALKEIAGAPADLQKKLTKGLDDVQSGKISVKDFLQFSAKEIEQGFKEGKFSESVKKQLEVAIGGTPLEDVGAGMFTKIFSAPIPVDQIKARAADAGKTLDDGFQPTFFQKIGNEFELLKTKAVEFAAPLIKGIGGVLTPVAQLAPGIATITDKFGGLSGIMTKIAPIASTAWAALTGPVGLVVLAVAAAVGIFVLLYKNVDSFRKLVDRVVGGIVSFAKSMYAQLKPVLVEIGNVLQDLGAFIIDSIVVGFEIFFDVVGGIVGALADLVSSIFDFNDSSVDMGNVVEDVVGFLKDLRTYIKFAQLGLSGLKAGFGEVKNIVVEFINAVANGNLSDAFDIISSFFNGGAAKRVNDTANAAIRYAQILSRIPEIQKSIGEDIIKASSLGDMQKAFDVLRVSQAARLKTLESLNLNPDDFREATAAITEQYLEAIATIREKFTKPPPDGGGVIPPPSAKVVKQITDLSDSLLALQRTNEQTIQDIRLKNIRDEGDRRRLEIEENRRRAEQAAADSLAKQIKDINALKDDETTIQINGKVVTKKESIDAFRAEYNRQIQLINDAARDETARANIEIARDRVSKFLETDKRISDQRLKDLTIEEQLMSGLSLEELAARNEKRLEIQRAQQKQELDDFVSGLEEFQTAAADIEVQFAGDPVRREAELRALLDRVARTNASALLLQRKHESDLTATRSQGVQERQDLEAELQDTAAKRERAQGLLAAQRQLDKELKQAGSNNDLKLQAQRNFNRARFDLEEAYLRKTDVLYASHIAFVEALNAKLFTSLDDSRRKDLESQRDAKQKEIDQLLAARRPYAETSADLQKLLLEHQAITQQLVGENTDFFSTMLRGIDAGFEGAKGALQTHQNEVIGEKLKRLKELDKVSFGDIGEELLDIGEVAGTVAGQISATFGQMIASQEKSFEAYGRVLLQTVLRTVQTLIITFAPAIFAAAMGPPLGPVAGAIAAGIGIATLSGLLAVAEGAVANWGSKEEGGYTGRGPRSKIGGVYHMEEFVFNARETDEHRPLFDHIHSGKSEEHYFREHYAHLITSDDDLSGARMISSAIAQQTSVLHGAITAGTPKTRGQVIPIPTPLPMRGVAA